MPILAVTVRSTPGSVMSATRARKVFCGASGPCQVGVGQDDDEYLTAVAAGEVAVAQGRPQRGADIGQGLIADRVPETFVDVAEVVEIDHQQADRVGRAGSVGKHAFKVSPTALLWAAPSESRWRPEFGDGEIPQVREHRRRLTDGVPHALPLLRCVVLRSGHEDRGDDLAAHGKRSAGRLTRTLGAHQPAQQCSMLVAVVVDTARAHRQRSVIQRQWARRYDDTVRHRFGWVSGSRAEISSGRFSQTGTYYGELGAECRRPIRPMPGTGGDWSGAARARAFA